MTSQKYSLLQTSQFYTKTKQITSQQVILKELMVFMDKFTVHVLICLLEKTSYYSVACIF